MPKSRLPASTTAAGATEYRPVFKQRYYYRQPVQTKVVKTNDPGYFGMQQYGAVSSHTGLRPLCSCESEEFFRLKQTIEKIVFLDTSLYIRPDVDLDDRKTDEWARWAARQRQCLRAFELIEDMKTDLGKSLTNNLDVDATAFSLLQSRASLLNVHLSEPFKEDLSNYKQLVDIICPEKPDKEDEKVTTEDLDFSIGRVKRSLWRLLERLHYNDRGILLLELATFYWNFKDHSKVGELTAGIEAILFETAAWIMREYHTKVKPQLELEPGTTVPLSIMSWSDWLRAFHRSSVTISKSYEPDKAELGDIIVNWCQHVEVMANLEANIGKTTIALPLNYYELFNLVGVLQMSK